MFLSVLSAVFVVAAAAANSAERIYHPISSTNFVNPRNLNQDELQSEYWVKQAQDALKHRIKTTIKEGVAKNVIMFLGDGMSFPTLAAARALQGQRAGRTGEEEQLFFEKFPITGLVKTYCVNNQVADSACSATAYLCGVKANTGTIGVNAQVPRRDCQAALREGTHVSSIAEWALKQNRSAGVVTTTRITHASPAGVYANVADRSWENDADVKSNSHSTDDCPDIADQMINQYPANEFKVILGGGKRNFLPTTQTGGRRTDDRDLTEEWINDKVTRRASHKYVQDLTELRGVDIDSTDYLLGLFSLDHMPYNMEADKKVVPTLEEMTEVAINLLQKDDEGFFLFVEGGRIDHAHHDNRVELALDETLEFSKAIEKARAMTSEDDTLIIVTADHSHVMAYNGYSQRGHDVLGPARDRDSSGVPYMIMSYTNGPGFRQQVEGVRPDVTKENTFDQLRWRTHADFPLSSETHGGEDVPVFASGPQQHIFTGLYEQSNLPHMMAYASCMGDGLVAEACNSAVNAVLSSLLITLVATLLFIN